MKDLENQIQRIIDFRTTVGHSKEIVDNHRQDLIKLREAYAKIDYLVLLYSSIDIEYLDDED